MQIRRLLIAAGLFGFVFFGSVSAASDKLINIDLTFLPTRNKISYITPILLFEPQTIALWENIHELQKRLDEYASYSSSAFTVVYRQRLFLITNAHVISDRGPQHNVAFFYNGNSKLWVRVPVKPQIITSLDLAAYDITGIKGTESIVPAVLEPKIHDMSQGATPLFLLCNPLKFAPFFTGLFARIENGTIAVDFSGDGVKGGCSGSPFVDYTGKVRGVLHLARGNWFGGIDDRKAWARPSYVVIKFLEAFFFEYPKP